MNNEPILRANVSTNLVQFAKEVNVGTISSILNRLQVGAELQGKLMMADGQVILQMDEGTQVAVKLTGQMPLDQLLQFKVIGKEEGQLVLQQVTLETKSALTDEALIEKIIKQLELPERPEMKSVIRQFFDKQLPFIKEDLLRAFQTYKSYDIPLEVSTRLIQQHQPINAEELVLMASIKKNGFNDILLPLNTVINEVESLVALKEIMTVLLDEFNTLISINKEVKGPIHLERNAKDVVLETSNERSASGLETKELGNLVLSEISAHTKKDGLQSLFVAVTAPSITPTAQRSLFAELSKLILQEQLYVTMEDAKEPQVLASKIEHTTVFIERIIQTLKKYPLNKEQQVIVDGIEKQVQTLSKFQLEAQYYCFPVVINQEERPAELYFFKPKKKNKNQEAPLYIVLALDMPNIHKIEVHLKIQELSLNIGIKVADESLEAYFKNNVEWLKKALKQYEFNVVSIDISHLDSEIIEALPLPSLYQVDLKV